MPTDTVYGLVARAHDAVAVTRLYALKKRERKPGTLVAASINQLRDLGVPENLLKRVEHFWPGPISIILPIGKKFAYLHQGVGDIAMRVPAEPKFQKILQATGPLVTSSANHPGAPGSVTVQEAIDYFGNSVDFYVDGGNLSGQPASTIIKVSEDNSIEIIREGAVKVFEYKEPTPGQ